ncbi:MAG: MFS transporter [Proteobacteria bacterium]|nr:MFS transporter [Pseudomonadota bacterium]
MFKTVLNSWSLFFGLSFIMMANGLQGTLIGINAVEYDFNIIATGLIFTGYFVGYLTGSLSMPKFISSVGHIRVFAAFSSLASLAILLHWLFIDVYAWALIRLITGFSMAGVYVVCESWLNDRADNSTRGQLLSFYFLILYISQGAGFLLINTSPTLDANLYILASVLISLGLVPILITKKPAPEFTLPKQISLKKIYIKSPLAFIGGFAMGLIFGTTFGLLAVFAAKINLTIFEISILVCVNNFAGGLAQYPFGWLSDRMDRRHLITILNIGSLVSVILAFTLGQFSFWVLVMFIGLHASLAFPIYSIVIAHMNDFMEKEEMVSASAAISVINGIGCSCGPLLASLSMLVFGPYGLIIFLILIYATLVPFCLYRIKLGRNIKFIDENRPTILVPSS